MDEPHSNKSRELMCEQYHIQNRLKDSSVQIAERITELFDICSHSLVIHSEEQEFESYALSILLSPPR
jgi:predicted glycoside hydrolase/deacetylase ChbG (UPF0249 family)